MSRYPAFDRRELDVHRLVAPQAVDQRDEETVQDRVLAREGSACVRGLGGAEHPGASPDPRPRGLAERRGRSDLHLGVVADALQLPRRVPGANERPTTINGDVHRCTYRRAVAAIGREENSPLANKGLESRRRFFHRATSGSRDTLTLRDEARFPRVTSALPALPNRRLCRRTEGTVPFF